MTNIKKEKKNNDKYKKGQEIQWPKKKRTRNTMTKIKKDKKYNNQKKKDKQYNDQYKEGQTIQWPI
jgi:hypothetical protein